MLPIDSSRGSFIDVDTQIPQLQQRLERSIAHLERSAEFPLVLQLVEHWTKLGEPSAVAQLAAVRSLMALCQMDRAWIRLRNLLELHPQWLPALKTAAQLFIDRGWPSHARRPLTTALEIAPEDSTVLSLIKKSQQPAPPAPQFPIDQQHSFEDRLRLVKYYLAGGSTLRGQTLLAKLTSVQPNQPILNHLKWALSGDYRLVDMALWEHYAENDHDFGPLPDLGEAPEPTDSAGERTPSASHQKSRAKRFPSLFLPSSDQSDPDDHTGEITHSQSLADTHDMRQVAGPEHVVLGAPQSQGGDTQINRVFHRSKQSDKGSDQAIHTSVPEDLGAFDFNLYRQQMGMDNVESQAEIDSDYIDQLEEEDANLIVLVRHEGIHTPKHDDPTSEWLAPDPTTADPSVELLIDDTGTAESTALPIAEPVNSEAETMQSSPPSTPKPSPSLVSASIWASILMILLIFGLAGVVWIFL
jgi:hypothetical protein